MDDHLKLANRLCDIVIGNVTCMQTWSFYLFDPEFDNEPELRSKIGVIWFCSLLDTLEASQNHLPNIAAEACRFGFEALEHNSHEIDKFCKAIGKIISHYSREEQAFIINIRNQYVHGYLNGRHQEKINFKYYINGKVKKEILPFAVYNDMIRPFFTDSQNVDISTLELLSFALDRKNLYWRLAMAFKKDMDEIYKGIRIGEKILVDLSKEIEDPFQ